MLINEIKDKINGKIAILGFGKEGKSALKFLIRLGATNITIHDKNPFSNNFSKKELLTTLAKIAFYANLSNDLSKQVKDKLPEGHKEKKYLENKYKFITGEDYTKNLNTYDLIIKSPGISPYLNDFSGLEGKITTPTEIFINNYEGKIIGITGTKGKSTTSTVVNLALQNAGFKTKLVGNIGNPVLDEIDILKPKAESGKLKGNNEYDYIIYEMSSYMLEGIKPQLYIGYINNIYDCHLDWHKGKENYQSAKLNILKYSKYKIANYDLKSFIMSFSGYDPIIFPSSEPSSKQNLDLVNSYSLKDSTVKLWNDTNLIFFGGSSNILYKDNFFYVNGKKVLEDKNILLNGPHNRTNISGILAILKAISDDGEDINNLINGLKITLSSFSGLPYRIENIGTYKGITFINDAMATTPDSTIAAINTFGKKIGTLFLGGQDSGFQFTKLSETIKKFKIPNLVILPDIGEKIFPELLDVQNYGTDELKSNNTSHKLYYVNYLNLGDNYKPKVIITESMEEAVKFAYDNTKISQIVLLSTGAPFIKIDGIWNPYTTKGNLFNEFVKKFGSSEYKTL